MLPAARSPRPVWDEPDDLDLTVELDRPAWHAHAACRGHDTGLFFVGQGGDTAPAKALCAGCPVHGDCLAWALDQGVTLHGIFAGTSPRERVRLRRQQRTAA